jgi:hypothetical protein
MMAPERIAARLEDVVSRLDVVAGWHASDGDIQASVEVALAAEKLHALRLELEREQFAAVAA